MCLLRVAAEVIGNSRAREPVVPQAANVAVSVSEARVRQHRSTTTGYPTAGRREGLQGPPTEVRLRWRKVRC